MMRLQPQQVFLVPLLLGTDGNQKMSKSLDNYIGITDPPYEMYGKVMSIPDHLILDYFELVTDVSDEELEEFRYQLARELINPMLLKKRLAREIVAQFHSHQAAQEAEENFTKVFQKREMPEEATEYAIQPDRLPPALFCKLLVDMGIIVSRQEAKRLIKQGAIEVNGEKVSSEDVTICDGSVIKIGKHRFARLVNSGKRR
jgi:tyrosyl-tRNA synthetase